MGGFRRAARRTALPADALHPPLRGDAARAVRGGAAQRHHARLHRPGGRRGRRDRAPRATGDHVFSNHRCHGHYLAWTGDALGLLAEIMGKEGGVCGGHRRQPAHLRAGLHVQRRAGRDRAGRRRHRARQAAPRPGRDQRGLHRRRHARARASVYETLNLAALWQLPLLVVVEDNGMAAEHADHASTWRAASRRGSARSACRSARSTPPTSTRSTRARRRGARRMPRDGAAPACSSSIPTGSAITARATTTARPRRSRRAGRYDPLVLHGTRLEQTERAAIDAEVEARSPTWSTRARRSRDLSRAPLGDALRAPAGDDPRVVMLGEDIVDPYGGAFKVTRGPDHRLPRRASAPRRSARARSPASRPAWRWPATGRSPRSCSATS